MRSKLSTWKRRHESRAKGKSHSLRKRGISTKYHLSYTALTPDVQLRLTQLRDVLKNDITSEDAKAFISKYDKRTKRLMRNSGIDVRNTPYADEARKERYVLLSDYLNTKQDIKDSNPRSVKTSNALTHPRPSEITTSYHR